jgi:CheY-like chemotaxis protein
MEAKDGHDAQEWLEGHLVDLMVTDYQMPGITGLQLIQWVKSHKKTECLPIVFYSGQLTADLKARALHSGASAVLEKPFSFQEFLHLIAQVGGESLA